MIIGVSGCHPIRIPHVLTHTNKLTWISLEIPFQSQFIIIHIHQLFNTHYIYNNISNTQKINCTKLQYYISLHSLEQGFKQPTTVALAQARKSSLGERLSRLGESISPGRGFNSGKN